jgi:hypothetical protein
MEPEGSLPCSQEPSTGAYPELDSIHTIPSYLHKIHFNIVTCAPIAKQRVGREVPAKTDSW